MAKVTTINKTEGGAIIPKASFANPDILFEGSAGVIGTEYSLAKNYKDYQFLLFNITFKGGTGDDINTSFLINVQDIIERDSAQFVSSVYNGETHNTCISFSINANNAIKIVAIRITSWTNLRITKVYGIK